MNNSLLNEENICVIIKDIIPTLKAHMLTFRENRPGFKSTAQPTTDEYKKEKEERMRKYMQEWERIFLMLLEKKLGKSFDSVFLKKIQCNKAYKEERVKTRKLEEQDQRQKNQEYKNKKSTRNKEKLKDSVYKDRQSSHYKKWMSNPKNREKKYARNRERYRKNKMLASLDKLLKLPIDLSSTYEGDLSDVEKQLNIILSDKNKLVVNQDNAIGNEKRDSLEQEYTQSIAFRSNSQENLNQINDDSKKVDLILEDFKLNDFKEDNLEIYGGQVDLGEINKLKIEDIEINHLEDPAFEIKQDVDFKSLAIRKKFEKELQEKRKKEYFLVNKNRQENKKGLNLFKS